MRGADPVGHKHRRQLQVAGQWDYPDKTCFPQRSACAAGNVAAQPDPGPAGPLSTSLSLANPPGGRARVSCDARGRRLRTPVSPSPVKGPVPPVPAIGTEIHVYIANSAVLLKFNP